MKSYKSPLIPLTFYDHPWQVALGSMDMDALLDSIPKLEEQSPDDWLKFG